VPGPDWQFLFLRPIDVELMLRVVLAFVLGGLIGYEREMIERPAGLRTHMLVAAGSAIFTTLSGFATLRWGRPPSRRRRLIMKPGEPSITGEEAVEEEETIVD
jgi:hypothetical protein